MTTQIDYDNNGSLALTRTYDAPHETVFDAWIQTSKVQQWWGNTDTIKVVSEIEPEVGGKYYHLTTLNDQHKHSANGVITEYDPPALLAYVIGDPENPDASMSVRVEFIDHGNQTEVRLTHKGIPDEFSPFIIDGWTTAFGKLYRFLIQEAHAA